MLPSLLVRAVPQPLPLRVALALALTSGNNAARAAWVNARASRTRASATLIVWLLTSTGATSASSFGSLKTSHQLPRASWSRGSAGFHGIASLYAEGDSAVGRT